MAALQMSPMPKRIDHFIQWSKAAIAQGTIADNPRYGRGGRSGPPASNFRKMRKRRIRRRRKRSRQD